MINRLFVIFHVAIIVILMSFYYFHKAYINIYTHKNAITNKKEE